MNNASEERGSAGERSMVQFNTMDRYSQNSVMAGSINRQSTASRSMGGGRR